MKRTTTLHGAGVGAVLAGASIVVGCQTPTEMIVRVTTDFDCSALTNNETTMRLAPDFNLQGPVSTQSFACADRYAGSVVLTPSDNGDRVTIEVMAALSPAALDPADGTCKEGKPGCIHARRSLLFIEHKALNVPIELEESCAGVPCTPEYTCKSGLCVVASIDSSQCGSDCVLGGDGGIAPRDGGVDASGDATLDAPVPPPVDAAVDSPANFPDAAIACGDMSLLASDAPWPMDRYCPGHTGVSPLNGPASAPTLRSTYDITSGGGSPPDSVVIDADNRCFILTHDGVVRAIPLDANPADGGGVLTWTASVNGGAIANSGGLALTKDGYLYAASDLQVSVLDPANGAIVAGPTTLPDAVRSTLGADGHGLYFSGPNKNVVQIRGRDADGGVEIGGAQATYIEGSVDDNSPTLMGTTLYVGANNGAIHTVIDTASMTAGIASLPVYASGLVGPIAVGSDDRLRVGWTTYNGPTATHFVGSYHLNAGTLYWLSTVGHHGAKVVAAAPSGRTYLTDDDGVLWAIEADGGQAWGGLSDGGAIGPSTSSAPFYPGFAANGTVYTVDDHSSLSAVAESGAVLWSGVTLQATPWYILIGKDNTLVLVYQDSVEVYR